MSARVVTPALGESSFSCPHCGALAAQTWFKLYSDGYGRDGKPWFPDPEVFDRIKNSPAASKEQKENAMEFFKRALSKEIFHEYREQSCYSHTEIVNLCLSSCFSCDKYAIWHADGLLYPVQLFGIEPNVDMPDDVRLDFDEAASIVDVSPRGAAALLRLSIEKLMPHLGATKKKIDDNIGELVSRGLDSRIQKALDVVRVIGNQAVHPGQIDLRDDKATATKLFGLVNLIVEAMISTPKHIDKMYSDLPDGVLAAIEKRDKPNGQT